MHSLRLTGLENTKVKLDLKDKKIMTELINDGKISITHLAKKVGLKRDTVQYRVHRLIEQKIITGFIPQIDIKKLGYSEFEVCMLFEETDEEKKNKLIEELSKLPYTKSILEYNDRWDVKHSILARTPEEFDTFNEEIEQKYGKQVFEKEKVITLKNYAKTSITQLILPEKTPETDKQKKTEKTSNYNFDIKDMHILRELSKDCRQSTYTIGEKVGMSADGVGLRMKKLLEQGIIKKYTILFDNSKLSLTWHTFAVKIRQFDPHIEKKIQYLVNTNPKILSVRKTIGSWDMLFSLVVESQTEIHNAIKEIKKQLSGYITNNQVWTAHKEPYFTVFPEIIAKENVIKQHADDRI